MKISKIKQGFSTFYTMSKEFFGFIFFWLLLIVFLAGGTLSIKMEDGIIERIVRLFIK